MTGHGNIIYFKQENVMRNCGNNRVVVPGSVNGQAVTGVQQEKSRRNAEFDHVRTHRAVGGRKSKVTGGRITDGKETMALRIRAISLTSGKLLVKRSLDKYGK